MTVDSPGDAREQEANRTAEGVIQKSEPSSAAPAPGDTWDTPLGCTCGGACSDCLSQQAELERISVSTRQVSPSADGPAQAPLVVQQVLRSPGEPMDPASRAFFEPRFGHDFSAVKIHVDGRAVASAHALRARAYAVGRHIVFGRDQFAPETLEGRRLLAHELVHVVQQSAVSQPDVSIARQAEPEAREEVESEEDAEEEFRHVLIPVRRPANQNAPTQEGEEPSDWRPAADFEPALSYPDQGAHTDWGRAAHFRAQQKQAAILRYHMESRLRASLTPGGSAPDFVTVESEQLHPLTRDEGFVYDELEPASSIPFRPRVFHLPDAIEHDLGLANTPDEAEGLVLGYFPELGPNAGLGPVAPLQAPIGLQLPTEYQAPDGRLYHPSLPRGAVIGRLIPDFDQAPLGARSQLFRVTAEKLRRQRARTAVLAEAEDSALGGRRRRTGACPPPKKTFPASSGTKSSSRHNAYAAHVAKALGYPTIAGGRTELTWKTPEGVSYAFDTFNPLNENEVWEVKTQHEWTSPLGMATAPHRVKGEFDNRVIGLELQRLKGLYVANRCGLTFRYAVDNMGAYAGLNQTWLGLPPVVYIPGP